MTGEVKRLRSKVKFEFDFREIPNITYKIEAYLMEDLPVEMILGINFMTREGVSINLKERTLTIGEAELELPSAKENENFPTTTVNDILYDTNERQVEAVNKFFFENDSNKQLQKELETAVKNIKDSNPELGTIQNTIHHIPTNVDFISKSSPYTIPYKLWDSTKAEIDRLLNKSIIQESNSRFCSPCFPLKKSDGSIRLIVDFRELNKVTLPCNLPFPNLDDTYADLAQCKIFTKLDLENGYYQIPIAEKDTFKTSFSTPWGQFEFLKMPFGLASAPKTFQQQVGKLFKGVKGVKVFVDDILIASSTEVEHLEALKKVQSIIVSHNISLKLNKCEFLKKKISFLGNILEDGKLKIDIEKVNWDKLRTVPTTRRQLQKLLGYVNWFRPYIRGLSELISPLYEKLKGNTNEFSWTTAEQQVLEKVISEVEKQQELTLPNFNQPFKLYTDSSDNAIGAVLVQGDQIVRLFSAKLTGGQKNYTTVEKEMLAIILSLKAFRKIILCSPITIYSDNRNLSFDKNPESQRYQRWKMALQEYDAKLEFLEGKNNQGADILSRLYLVNEEGLMTEAEIATLQSEWLESNPNYLEEKGFQLIDHNEKKLIIDAKRRVVVTPNFEELFIKKLHGKLLHPGSTRAYLTIKRYFIMNKLKEKLVNCCSRCFQCQTEKNSASRRGSLTGNLVSEKPMSRISTDILGPIDLNKFGQSGKCSILTITDLHSRFTISERMKVNSGLEVVRILRELWIPRFGKPDSILADNGTQFHSEEFKGFCEDEGILRRFCTPYNPTGNSVSERQNGVLVNMLRCSKGENIDSALRKINSAMSLAVNRNTGFSPLEILNKQSSLDPLGRSLDITDELVTTNLTQAAEKETELRNKIRTEWQPKVGESVWLKIHRKLKMDSYYEGPYKITEVKQNGALVVENESKRLRVNIKRVKPVKEEEELDAEGGKMSYDNIEKSSVK